MSVLTPAWTQQVAPRSVAAHGTLFPDRAVWEAAIAAGPDEALVLYNFGPPQGHFNHTIGHAIGTYDANAGTWTWGDEGVIEDHPSRLIGDPSIEYDRAEGGFLACSLMFANRWRVGVARYSNGQFEPAWRFIATFGRSGSADRLDKPMLIAGEVINGKQEYYVVFMELEQGSDDFNYAYRRSVDGGRTWAGERIQVKDPGRAATGQFSIYPAVHDDGPLYVAYPYRTDGAKGATLRFLMGTDRENGEVRFRQIVSAEQPVSLASGRPPLEILLNRASLRNYCPQLFKVLLTPFLLADPTDPDRLFLVYQDTETDDSGSRPNKCAILCQTLRRSGPLATDWVVGPRVQVSDAPGDSDSLLPGANVDDAGRIHVVFYDDRNYEQADGQLDPPPKFDVYYAYSVDGGASFQPNVKLYEAPDPKDVPALDYAQITAPYDRPGEYLGLTTHKRGQSTEVMVAFGGTDPDEPPDDHKSVIWWTSVLFP
jgi:hypothetical protein